MDALIVGLLFLIPGIIYFLYVLFGYSEEKHQKELEKYSWLKDSWDLSDIMVLLHKIGSKSYYFAKVIILLVALFPIAIGVLALWSFFSG